MKILAFHNYASHDAGAAALHDDGEHLRVATISEERLSRVKYSYFFPMRAIDSCMRRLSIESLREFDLVATDYAFTPRLQNTNLRYRKLEADYIKTRLDLDFGKLLYVDHHAAHAASAFYPSGFDDAAILVVDGVGSAANTNSLYVGNRRTGLRLIDKAFGMGIGLLYTLITRRVLNLGTGEEGKTMGLAAVGAAHQTRGSILRLAPRYDRLVTDYSDTMWRTPSLGLRQPLPRCPDRAELTNDYYARIAYELQDETERCMLHLARYAREATGQDRLCIAGGVALNCVANERIVRETPYREVFIQPAASDTGIPLGLALWAYHEQHKGRRQFAFRHVFTGAHYAAAGTAQLLTRFGIAYRHATLGEVAARLADGHVVGWFIEGSELGPRALGHRSILADPRRAEMKDVLNAKVKHREMFRPFAPSVLEERADDYFDMSAKSPFMLLAPRVRREKIDEIPAVVHVDGSARVHTVSAATDSQFYSLIAEFDALTGVPVLINTSFNDNGEPIVETPLDALICFLRTQMDCLYLDGLLIDRRDLGQGPQILEGLLDARIHQLKADYRAALDRLCPAYDVGELQTFLRAYHPMHVYHSRLHTLVKLQEALSGWSGGRIYTDDYHLDIVRRYLPEEFARHQARTVVVADAHASIDLIENDALVVLFNLSLDLKGRRVVNFYDDLSLLRLIPPVEGTADNDLECSNEYRSSSDWDAFYARLLQGEH